MFRRLGAWVANWFSSKFEAARKSTSRSDGTWWNKPDDARIDYTAADRDIIQEKSRWFERNNAIANRLADIFEQFTVGPNGLQIIPASTDEEWNQRHTRSWHGWQNYCDLTSLFHFSTLQSQIARTWFFDGEVFILKTWGEGKQPNGDRRPTPRARPRIQLIEAHRVKTPPKFYAEEGRTVIDGIKIDQRGRKIGYYVYDRTADGKEAYTEYSTAEMLHVFEPHRPGEYRGRPFLTPVLNDLHDLDDLQKFEMQAAKEAGQIANVLTNAAGEFPSAPTLVREKITQGTQNSSGTAKEENRTTFVQKVFGSKSIALRKGEDFKQFSSNRPSVATREYWDYLTAKICAGVGISKLLVFPWSIQGTVTRADLDIASGFFRSRSALLAWAFKQIYLWHTEWAINNEEDSSDPPADGSWRECSYRPPRSVNVDVGRNSQALLAEFDAGFRTMESVYAELGLDWRAEIRQRFREEKYLNDLAASPEFVGVTIDRVRGALREQMKAEAEEKKKTEEAIAA